MANPLGKSREIENPYATFEAHHPDLGHWEIRVLKTHKLPKNENEYATWYTAGKSDATGGRWEYGDMYRSEIIRMRLTYASPEFIEAYRDTPHFALKEALERVAA
tara:strand:- start:23 stop:337 length:315 start_codon:yes stop_codon:yes gene_type:complete